MDACFLDASQARKPFVMGCYGIGISRIAAAAIEQNHDEKGIVWPPAIAPFHAVVVVARSNDAAAARVGEDLERALEGAGIETVLDDRVDASAGVKFKDAELVGYPAQVTVGKHVAEGKVEVKSRRTGEVSLVEIAKAPDAVAAVLAAYPSGRSLGEKT
jgi:prolyl-tRNA synthetase